MWTLKTQYGMLRIFEAPKLLIQEKLSPLWKDLENNALVFLHHKTTTLRCEIPTKFRNEIKTQILTRNFSKQQIRLVRSHGSKD